MPIERNFRGFPFEEEEGGAWSELASRHPDIAARLQRPRAPPAAATTGAPSAPHAPADAQPFHRKRRPDHADQQDFGANFDGFDRFPFDNIPPEFRGHLPPQYWNRRYEDHPQQAPQHPQTPQQPQAPQRQTIATQTDPEDIEPKPIPLPHIPFNQIEAQNQPQGQYQQEQEATQSPQYGVGNPVEPVQPQRVEGESHPPPAPPTPAAYQQGPAPNRHHEHTNMSQESQHEGTVRLIPIQVEGRDVPVQNHRAASPSAPPHPHATPFDDNYHHPSFGPFRTGFNPNPRPYSSHKAYPQGQQYARGMSPQRSHSPNPQPQHQEYVDIPVQHEVKQQQHPTPQQQQQYQQQQYQQQQQQKFQQQQQQQQPNQQPAAPQPQTKPDTKDPITQILAIQTDVLKLMTEVENFSGCKKDKQYIYLDEMLTRKILALDDIETEGKENIRAARKEAIRCIEKCIAVLEAKAERGSQSQPAAADVEMKQDECKPENGDANADTAKDTAQQNTQGTEQPQVDTRPDDKPEEKEKKGNKKVGKATKKRDKSKDKNVNKDGMNVDSNSNADGQAMEVDGAASQ